MTTDRYAALRAALADEALFDDGAPANETILAARAFARAAAETIAALLAERDALRAIVEMADAVIEGAVTEFVRVPYGASHEDVAQINDWHRMAAETRSAIAALAA